MVLCSICRLNMKLRTFNVNKNEADTFQPLLKQCWFSTKCSLYELCISHQARIKIKCVFMTKQNRNIKHTYTLVRLKTCHVADPKVF